MGDTPVTGVVYNDDVDGLQRRINRFITELANSASAGVSLTSTFDQGRLQSYLNALITYHDWIMAQPQLDLVETNDKKIILEADPVVQDVENEDVDDVINLLVRARDELINSQSARMPSGLVSFDSARFMALVTKAGNFLTAYIQTTTPIDLPQSSPQDPVQDTGKRGV